MSASTSSINSKLSLDNSPSSSLLSLSKTAASNYSNPDRTSTPDYSMLASRSAMATPRQLHFSTPAGAYAFMNPEHVAEPYRFSKRAESPKNLLILGNRRAKDGRLLRDGMGSLDSSLYSQDQDSYLAYADPEINSLAPSSHVYGRSVDTPDVFSAASPSVQSAGDVFTARSQSTPRRDVDSRRFFGSDFGPAGTQNGQIDSAGDGSAHGAPLDFQTELKQQLLKRKSSAPSIKPKRFSSPDKPSPPRRGCSLKSPRQEAKEILAYMEPLNTLNKKALLNGERPASNANSCEDVADSRSEKSLSDSHDPRSTKPSLPVVNDPKPYIVQSSVAEMPSPYQLDSSTPLSSLSKAFMKRSEVLEKTSSTLVSVHSPIMTDASPQTVSSSGKPYPSSPRLDEPVFGSTENNGSTSLTNATPPASQSWSTKPVPRPRSTSPSEFNKRPLSFVATEKKQTPVAESGARSEPSSPVKSKSHAALPKKTVALHQAAGRTEESRPRANAPATTAGEDIRLPSGSVKKASLVLAKVPPPVARKPSRKSPTRVTELDRARSLSPVGRKVPNVTRQPHADPPSPSLVEQTAAPADVSKPLKLSAPLMHMASEGEKDTVVGGASVTSPRSPTKPPTPVKPKSFKLNPKPGLKPKPAVASKPSVPRKDRAENPQPSSQASKQVTARIAADRAAFLGTPVVSASSDVALPSSKDSRSSPQNLTSGDSVRPTVNDAAASESAKNAGPATPQGDSGERDPSENTSRPFAVSSKVSNVVVASDASGCQVTGDGNSGIAPSGDLVPKLSKITHSGDEAKDVTRGAVNGEQDVSVKQKATSLLNEDKNELRAIGAHSDAEPKGEEDVKTNTENGDVNCDGSESSRDGYLPGVASPVSTIAENHESSPANGWTAESLEEVSLSTPNSKSDLRASLQR